jgi:hypothetical protein
MEVVMRSRFAFSFLIGLCLLGSALPAWGQCPDTAPPATCHPRCVPGVACYAVPSNCGPYCGYRVGGSCLCGHRASPTDGTWGWDYCGYLCKFVNLRWCPCRRYQNGPGAYRTVGPNCTSISTP